MRAGDEPAAIASSAAFPSLPPLAPIPELRTLLDTFHHDATSADAPSHDPVSRCCTANPVEFQPLVAGEGAQTSISVTTGIACRTCPFWLDRPREPSMRRQLAPVQPALQRHEPCTPQIPWPLQGLSWPPGHSNSQEAPHLPSSQMHCPSAVQEPANILFSAPGICSSAYHTRAWHKQGIRWCDLPLRRRFHHL